MYVGFRYGQSVFILVKIKGRKLNFQEKKHCVLTFWGRCESAKQESKMETKSASRCREFLWYSSSCTYERNIYIIIPATSLLIPAVLTDVIYGNWYTIKTSLLGRFTENYQSLETTSILLIWPLEHFSTSVEISQSNLSKWSLHYCGLPNTA